MVSPMWHKTFSPYSIQQAILFPYSIHRAILFPSRLSKITSSSMKAGKRTLFQLFKSKTDELLIKKEKISLPCIGRVENKGNTCAFSAILQHIASLPQYYDNSLFLTPFESKDPQDKTKEIQETQKHLYNCVKKIRQGDLVQKEEVNKLISLFQELGLCQQISSQCNFNCFKIYSQFNFYKCFDDIFRTFLVNTLLAKSTSKSKLDHLFGFLSLKNLNAVSEKLKGIPENKALWSIITNKSSKGYPDFALDGWHSSVKLAYVYKEIFGKGHMLLYRKHENYWICCDDGRMPRIKKLPTHNICTVVYESYRLPAAENSFLDIKF